MKQVGIIGGAGFIGSYVTRIFLRNGFSVKVSATDPSKSEKYQHLMITSVSPVLVMGRSLSERQDSTSGGMQFLFKNKIAPNPFVQMMYDQDILIAGVDVEDVAECVYQAAVKKGLHGRNYLLSSETYKVSDIMLMLNGAEPVQAPFIVYRNELAKKELDVAFRPLNQTLNAYAEQA